MLNFREAQTPEARSGSGGKSWESSNSERVTKEYQSRIVWKSGKNPSCGRGLSTLLVNLAVTQCPKALTLDKGGASQGIRFFVETARADVKKRYEDGISLAFGQRLGQS